MPIEESTAEAASSSSWHSIRPWSPPLSLSVREITSVSATFILSATFHDINGEGDPTLASLGITEDEPNDGEEEVVDEDNSESPGPKKASLVSGALAGGLSVDIDGAPWRRVLIRIDDKADEAVIIIYGLMPGRQYDIDLELVQEGQKNSIRRQVVTEDTAQQNADPTTDSDAQGHDHSDPSNSAPPTMPTPPSHSNQLPSPGFAPLTLEDRVNQLQHTLNLITTERDTLTVSLKTARRDAQKADAALRSEIEILKRASEKHNASEHRAKQKVLALQEAVKRAQTSTREMEEQVVEVNAALPDLRAQKKEKEALFLQVKSDADRARKEKDAEAEKERKRAEMMRVELASLTNKLEKLNGKKEKLESGVVPDLEEQLRAIEQEIDKVEQDPYGYDTQSDLVDDMDFGRGEAISDYMLNQLQFQRNRPANNVAMAPIGRPSQSSIQRPSHNGVNNSMSSSGSNGLHQQLWSTSPRLTHNQRSSSIPHHPQSPTLLINPNRQQRQSSLKSTAGNASSGSGSTASLVPTTTTPPTASTSTLSSRAAPFEPGRSLRVATGQSSGYSSSPSGVISRSNNNANQSWAG